MCNIPIMRKILILLLVSLLVSCSLPFGKKSQTAKAQKTEKGEKVTGEAPPQPGDIKLIDGTEYIYARNRQFNLTPYEPEYMWIRKDQYSPGPFEALRDKIAGAGNKKERQELEKRMAKLEEDLKKKGAAAPQVVYAAPGPASPGTIGRFGGPSPVAFSYASPKVKRRVLVLPVADQTNYKEEHLEELTTNRLISRLENSGAVIVVNPQSANVTAGSITPAVMKSLNDLYGIHAVVKGSLSDVYTTTSKVEGRADKETSLALSKISLEIYNTETGALLRQLSARNPVFLTREQGDMSSEKAKVKAIDLAIELIADDLLKSILSLDWHARIASLEDGKVFINAGRLSGLEKGDSLEVYSPGEQVMDKSTNAPLGRIKGNYKGEVEVFEVFGVDACWAKAKAGASFSPTDLVYFKK